MTDYPTLPRPTSRRRPTARLSSPKSSTRSAPTPPTGVTLLAELTARGFAEMSLSDILVCFPDFQELAKAHTGANPPDAVAAAKCAFLDTLPDTDSLPFGATITLRSTLRNALQALDLTGAAPG